MGARNWIRKNTWGKTTPHWGTNPDIFIVTEANLLWRYYNWAETNRRVSGNTCHSLWRPGNTAEYWSLSRMVSMSRSERTDFMDKETASIWIEIGRKGKKPLMLGAMYTESTASLRQQGRNQSADPAQQNAKMEESFWTSGKLWGAKHDTFVSRWYKSGLHHMAKSISAE